MAAMTRCLGARALEDRGVVIFVVLHFGAPGILVLSCRSIRVGFPTLFPASPGPIHIVPALSRSMVYSSSFPSLIQYGPCLALIQFLQVLLVSMGCPNPVFLNFCS